MKGIHKKMIYYGRRIFVDSDLLRSKAYLSLKTPACYIVFGIFLTKQQTVNIGTIYEPNWLIKNNGKITFTYREAFEKYGISEFKFRKAIENLVEVGLIDITEPGKYKQPTLYALSDRWVYYGTEAFEKKEVPKNCTSAGFRKGNRYGRHFTPEERENYQQELKQKKINPLLEKIDKLKQAKQQALLEDKKKGRHSRIPAIIDEEIDDCNTQLRKIKGK